MKPIIALTVLFFIFVPLYSNGQKEASVWPVGNGKQFNFQSGNFQYSDFNGPPGINATICDKDGNLLLMTDGDTVWNGKNEVLINGTDLIEEGYSFNHYTQPIFVPYPGKEGYYFLIYQYGHKVIDDLYYHYTTDSLGNQIVVEVEHTGIFRTSYVDQKLVYAEININFNNEQGEVISKQNFILSDYGDITIAGYCDNSYYWMAIPYNIPYFDSVSGLKKSVILLYKIDEKGISTSPKVNTYFNNGSFSSFHFSPSGDKVNFSFYTNEGNSYWGGGVIADFNFLTGELYNYRLYSDNFIPVGEFSSNSRFLYFIRGIHSTSDGEVVENISELVQFDTRRINYRDDSRDVIFDFIPNGDIRWGGSLGLAPDGKIYFVYYDDFEYKYMLGRINRPNNKGINCDIEFNIATLDSFPRPLQFVTSFFRDKSLDIIDEQYADAGPEKEVCYSSNINIDAGNYQPDDMYQWFPDQYIENPFSSEVTFSSPLFYGSPKTYTLTLRASDGNCWLNFDSTKVTIMPMPYKTIVDGGRFVCPFVEEVDYSAVENEYSLLWSVNGGEIIGNNSTDSIKVTWGEPNPNASVNVVATTGFGCKSDVAKFPVNVTTELMPETPVGYDTLCITEAKNVIYTTQNSNGSVYEWIVDGGVILDGQGTSEISVEWKHDGQNKIFVRETSETLGASCYGESEPLAVGILNDSLYIDISYVTFTLDNKLEVHFETDKLNLHYHTLIQHTENVNSGFVDEYYPKNSGFRGYYIYLADPEESGSQIINLEVINRCDEMFYSTAQQTVVLNGEIYPEQTTISLRWNLNQFWETDRIQHEIWHSVDGKNNWELVATVDRQTSFDYDYPNVSLFHYIRVKEINLDKNLESWSNVIDFQVSDILKIPSVFTPNGDGYNDTWKIWNLDSYIFDGLTIYNKTGEVVYKCNRAFIPWDGKINGRVYQGTYLYTITFEGSTRYGQITVLQ